MIKIKEEQEFSISEKDALKLIRIGMYAYNVWTCLRYSIENLIVATFFLMLFYFNEWEWIKGSEIFSMWLFITFGRVTYSIIRYYIQDIRNERKE